MTLELLLKKTLLLQVLFVATKVIFFGFLNVDLLAILIIYYLVLAAMSIAIVRRMGALNYFEAFFTMGLWLVLSLLTDFLLTANLAGKDIYNDGHFWWSYAIVLLVILIFHKKVHVEVRKGNLQR